MPGRILERLAPLGACLLLSIAACSSGTELPADGPTTAASDPQLAYVQCLRDNGLDVPDPTADGGISVDAEGLTPEQVQAAEAACADLQQEMLGADGGQELTEDEKQRILDMVACMRERGYDMPDPNFGGGVTTERDTAGSDSQGDAGPQPDDPAFQADAAECAAEAGVAGPSTNENDA